MIKSSAKKLALKYGISISIVGGITTFLLLYIMHDQNLSKNLVIVLTENASHFIICESSSLIGHFKSATYFWKRTNQDDQVIRTSSIIKAGFLSGVCGSFITIFLTRLLVIIITGIRKGDSQIFNIQLILGLSFSASLIFGFAQCIFTVPISIWIAREFKYYFNKKHSLDD